MVTTINNTNQEYKSKKRIIMKLEKNTIAIVLILIVAVFAAYLLFGNAPWANGMMHQGRSIGIGNWNWLQIIVCICIGILIGWVVARKRK